MVHPLNQKSAISNRTDARLVPATSEGERPTDNVHFKRFVPLPFQKQEMGKHPESLPLGPSTLPHPDSKVIERIPDGKSLESYCSWDVKNKAIRILVV